MCFSTHRNNLELQVRSADKTERIVRVRENEVEEFIRAYEAATTNNDDDDNGDDDDNDDDAAAAANADTIAVARSTTTATTSSRMAAIVVFACLGIKNLFFSCYFDGLMNVLESQFRNEKR